MRPLQQFQDLRCFAGLARASGESRRFWPSGGFSVPWPCLAGDVRIPYGQKSKALMVQGVMDDRSEG